MSAYIISGNRVNGVVTSYIGCIEGCGKVYLEARLADNVWTITTETDTQYAMDSAFNRDKFVSILTNMTWRAYNTK